MLSGILALLWQHGVEKGYDLAIISGTTRQAKLYQHLGFVPFGPLVGSGDAQFQPMYVTLETFEVTAREFLRSSPARSFHPSAVNFLPGPVTVRREVRRAFEQAPESHRGDGFKKDFQAARNRFSAISSAPGRWSCSWAPARWPTTWLPGSCRSLARPGLVLSNGEFGSRLVDQARRFNLKFEALEFPWGGAAGPGRGREKLSARTRARWLWCVHCETSTGVLNDLAALKDLVRRTRDEIVPGLHQHHRHDAGGFEPAFIWRRVPAARDCARIRACRWFSTITSRARAGAAAALSRPRLLRAATGNSVHVLVQPAARAARRRPPAWIWKNDSPKPPDMSAVCVCGWRNWASL